MKNLFVCSVAAVMGFVCLVSCSEQESDLSSAIPSSNHQLRIVTHTREGETPVTPLANIYLFKGDALVRTLQTDADNSYSSAAVKLSEGSYTLCALNASDLSRFLIPDNPTPTSVITKATGQNMGDLLMAIASVSLPDGTNKEVDMTLERKVLELSSFSVSQVPADVTAVTVAIAPFCSGVQFNGTYVDTDPVTCTFDLVASTATTGLWQLSPRQLVFPSIGTPTITVTFTRGENDASTYTYTAESALTANNKYDIAGTYTEPLGVTLSGTVTTQPWADPTDVNFDFDEQDNSNNTSTTDPQTGSGTDDPSSQGGGDSSETPLAGQTYKGCYVVSVDESKHTAVLLSPDENKSYSVNSSSPSDWLTYLNTQLFSWPLVNGVTGTWRIPTLTELNTIAHISGAVSKSNTFFCLENISQLCAVRIGVGATGNSVGTPVYTFGKSIVLRPVIDISY